MKSWEGMAHGQVSELTVLHPHALLSHSLWCRSAWPPGLPSTDRGSSKTVIPSLS